MCHSQDSKKNLSCTSRRLAEACSLQGSTPPQGTPSTRSMQLTRCSRCTSPQDTRCTTRSYRCPISSSCQERTARSRSMSCSPQGSTPPQDKRCIPLWCRCQPLRSCLQRTARSRSTSCIQQGSTPQQDTACRKICFLLRLSTIRQDTNRRWQSIQFPRSIFQGHKECRYWHRLHCCRFQRGMESTWEADPSKMSRRDTSRIQR
jgi:hypothetical protein